MHLVPQLKASGYPNCFRCTWLPQPNCLSQNRTLSVLIPRGWGQRGQLNSHICHSDSCLCLLFPRLNKSVPNQIPMLMNPHQPLFCAQVAQVPALHSKREGGTIPCGLLKAVAYLWMVWHNWGPSEQLHIQPDSICVVNHNIVAEVIRLNPPKYLHSWTLMGLYVSLEMWWAFMCSWLSNANIPQI